VKESALRKRFKTKIQVDLSSSGDLARVRNGLPTLPALTRKNYQQPVSLRRLRRHVLAEEIAGIFIAAIVSVLGIIEPAAG
jgi:hypothetical protein